MIDENDVKEISKIVSETLDEAGVTDAMKQIKETDRPTKEEILAVKNRAQRQKLIKENLDLFK